MAGFATHDIFGQEVLESISNRMLQSIVRKHNGAFGIGCQGPDLFLYNLPMQAGRPEKNIGSRMHQEKTGRFFAYLLWNIWDTENPLWMETGLGYLYGALAHYTLDSMVHPYIYARSGFDPEIPYSRKSTSGIHHRLEAAIDAKMIAVKQEILPSQYQPLENITIEREEKKALAGLLSQTVSKSYHVGMRVENVTSSIRMMRMIVCNFYGCTDKQKKRLQRLEGTFFEDYLCSNFLVADEYIKKQKIMNTENTIWRNPWKTSVKSKDSVWEIYDKALQQYQEYTEQLEPLMPLYLQKWVSLKSPYDVYPRRETSRKEIWEKICRASKGFRNLSYHSGLPSAEENRK